MRLARVIGTVTISRKLPDLKAGSWLIAEAFDRESLAARESQGKRSSPMPESLVVFDELGAAIGNVIAVSEGREAAMPFHPGKVPIDAYNAAIIDSIDS